MHFETKFTHALLIGFQVSVMNQAQQVTHEYPYAFIAGMIGEGFNLLQAPIVKKALLIIIILIFYKFIRLAVTTSGGRTKKIMTGDSVVNAVAGKSI